MAGIIDKIFDSSMQGLHKNMDMTMKRSEALLSNIANAETPGYRAVDVNFGSELDKAFERQSGALIKTNDKHMNIGANTGVAHIVADNTGTMRKDGNNVDIDLQMAKMAKNKGSFNGSAAMIRKKLHMIRQAIRFAQR
jgi:flagellar basal-body rod protein FlgB